MSGCAEDVHVAVLSLEFWARMWAGVFHVADDGPLSTKLLWWHLSSISLSRQYLKIFMCFLSLGFLRHRAAAAAHLPPPSRGTLRLRRSERPFPHEFLAAISDPTSRRRSPRPALSRPLRPLHRHSSATYSIATSRGTCSTADPPPCYWT
jgi:hypothetical protein